MSTVTISLAFEDFARVAQMATVAREIGDVTASRPKPTLRIALLCGEEFRFPSFSEWRLSILSGKAWVTFGGQDFFLGSDDGLTVPKVKHGAILSVMGKEALFFEIT